MHHEHIIYIYGYYWVLVYHDISDSEALHFCDESHGLDFHGELVQWCFLSSQWFIHKWGIYQDTGYQDY